MSQTAKPTVLLLEDEWLIAELLQEYLEAAGCKILGPASRVAEALQLLELGKPDIAVLDVSLRGENSFAVARALALRAIPFVFMTGYVGSDITDEFKDRPILNKPVDEAKLLTCIMATMKTAESASPHIA